MNRATVAAVDPSLGGQQQPHALTSREKQGIPANVIVPPLSIAFFSALVAAQKADTDMRAACRCVTTRLASGGRPAGSVEARGNETMGGCDAMGSGAVHIQSGGGC